MSVTAEGDGWCVICATADVEMMVDRPFDYHYTNFPENQREPDHGSGIVLLTTDFTNIMAVTATATPMAIAPGDSTLLKAVMTAGTPPFEYRWYADPYGAIDTWHDRQESLWAYPTTTTTFSLEVWDDNSYKAYDTVEVIVGAGLTVSASPDTINVGESSQLEAVGVGGTEPYSFAWLPTTGLDDASVADPIASPANTIEYEVTMTDAGSNVLKDTVEVVVRLDVDASTTPSSIEVGDSAQLGATVEGGKGAYTYAWTPTTGLSNAAIANPWAEPSQTTQYTVEVTDEGQQTDSDTVTVTVTGGSGPQACFTWTSADGPPVELYETVTLDPACSQGNIVAWEWWLGLSPGEPPLGEPNDSVSVYGTQPVLYWELGPHIVKLRVIDDQGRTDEMLDTIDVVSK